MNKSLLKIMLILLAITKITLAMDSSITQLENVRGSFAAAIYERIIDGKPHIEKTFKDQQEFNNELEKVLALKEPIRQYMLE